jgi:CRP-like cAMP-binding protein
VVLVGVLAPQIVSIDRKARVPITEMAILRATALLGALPGPALETIARESARVEVAADTVVVRQGDTGTQYFAVISGRLLVLVDGTERRQLERGDGFGEIALLRDVPRAATVRAVTDAVLLAIDRDPFLTAVTGHLPTRDRATSIASGYVDPTGARPPLDA